MMPKSGPVRHVRFGPWRWRTPERAEDEKFFFRLQMAEWASATYGRRRQRQIPVKVLSANEGRAEYDARHHGRFLPSGQESPIGIGRRRQQTKDQRFPQVHKGEVRE